MKKICTVFVVLICSLTFYACNKVSLNKIKKKFENDNFSVTSFSRKALVDNIDNKGGFKAIRDYSATQVSVDTDGYLRISVTIIEFRNENLANEYLQNRDNSFFNFF